ncbi:sarcolemmal membrane-associated protein-like isoform X1 [Eriocheir sinensis]|uniref:sarcolemmal membrane-associated protein-like isoform X1 n=1 Tax=Eriocheir sinensis TaxID=95602 RepID=UPI0021CAAF95|nr:sarcolemmal membrane-associated protein-like isoform X1 [Eriocheir sinensis]XP_050719168.1 sarcolemmal membrane-associated protein-like isoform X1 [Eriocheir sinensis]
MVNIVGVRTLVPPTVGGPPITEAKMTARAILQCRPNSHPFPERTLVLDQPVKIGRSVARARPATNNAIFDCKVLSRNHALLWYENGKFYLQDTKSSNGTFVNNQRLSKGSEESAPREVCSGDIVQFGVDVMENSRKVTHGCIVATLKLYMPDGQEAKASPSTAVGGAVSSVTAQELYQLRTYLQEAQHREQQIETKLAALQRLVSSTQEAATHSWKAMIDEDRLLQRLETLEGQLTTYAKNYPEDSVREEMRRLLDEKCQYETTAKESLRRVLQEKLDAAAKLADLERTLSTSEDELSHMKELCESSQKELAELLEKQAVQSEQVLQLTEKLKAAEDQLKDAEENYEQEKKEMLNKIVEKSSEENKLMARIESITAENDFTKEQLSALKAKYENIKNGEISGLLKPIKDSADLDMLSIEPSDMKHALEATQKEIHTLKDRLQTAQDELRQAEANVSQLKHEAELADSVEAGCLSTRARLQEELSDNKAKLAADKALTEHLQSQLATLEDRLREYQMISQVPKIYDDIYDDNTPTLVRKKKDLPKNKDKLNEDDTKDEECPNDLEDSQDSDTTLTIIPTKGDNNLTIIPTKECKDFSVNGSLEGKEEKEAEIAQESVLCTDIHRLQEMLETSRKSQEAAEKEVERVREELAQASTAAITASHEASNLRQQLAASEALMSEKVKTVASLQSQVGRLEDSSQEVQTQLSNLSVRLREEQQKVQLAQEETQTLRNKLSEAEELAQLSVQEAESLKNRILGLEERLEFSQASPTTPLILPPPVSRNIGSGESGNQTKTSIESLTPPASLDADAAEPIINAGSNDTAKSTSRTTVNEAGDAERTANISTKEAELAALKDTLKKLQEKLTQSQQECSALQERELTLKQTLERESQSATKDNEPVSSEKVDSLQEELQAIREERDRLRDKVGLLDEDYQVLTVQNKMAVALSLVPLCVVLLGIITAFYDTISAVTGTSEFHPPS